MFRSLGRIISSAVLLILTGLMMAAAKYLPALVFPAYRDVSRKVLSAIASVTGALPFALWEVLLVILALLFLYSIVHTLLEKKRFLSWLSGVVLALSVLVFLFTGLWGLNHYAPELSEEIGLEIGEYSKEELIAATKYYMAGAVQYAGQVERDADGQMFKDFDTWAKVAGSGYEALSQQYPVLSGSTAPVKKAGITWYLMSKMGYTGVFVDFTAESTVNPDTFSVSLPYTMCHEVAHRCTVAGEDEANFAAFLACVSNPSTEFIYSGYFMAFRYCYTALCSVPSYGAAEAASRIRAGVNEYLIFDMSAYDYFYSSRKNDTATKVGDTVNDTYLKTSGEVQGIASYGQVCDLLVNWYIQEEVLPALVVEQEPFDPLDPSQVDLSGIVNARTG